MGLLVSPVIDPFDRSICENLLATYWSKFESKFLLNFIHGRATKVVLYVLIGGERLQLDHGNTTRATLAWVAWAIATNWSYGF